MTHFQIEGVFGLYFGLVLLITGVIVSIIGATSRATKTTRTTTSTKKERTRTRSNGEQHRR